MLLMLLAKVVGEEHFGGFLTKVDSAASDEKKKTWKEKMEEIISKSKKAKVLCYTRFKCIFTRISRLKQT